MSSSSSNVRARSQKKPAHRKFNDGMTTAQFLRQFAKAHREFFLLRGVDPEASRTSANFEGRFGKSSKAKK